MGKALIQRRTHIEEAANAAFWINLILATAIAFSLYMSSTLVAIAVFQDARVAAVLQAMSVQIILSALCSVQTALLQKEMSFKKIFWVRFVTVSLPGIASVPLAWYGWGYWALVTGTLFGQAVQVFMLWRVTRWKPHFQFDFAIAKEISKFSSWVGITGILLWFYQWADSLIVGVYFGGHELGLYRMGNQLVTAVFALLLVPIVPVLYSLLVVSDLKEKKLSAHYNDLVNKVILVGVLLSVLVFVIFYFGSNFMFGEKWAGLGFVGAFFGLIHGYAWIVGFNGEYYRAAGKPHLETVALSVSMVFYILGYLIFAPIGLEEFVFARFALVFIGVFIHLYCVSTIVEVDFFRLFKNLLFTSLCAISCIFLAFLFWGNVRQDLFGVIFLSVATFLIYLAGIFLINKREVLIFYFSVKLVVYDK